MTPPLQPEAAVSADPDYTDAEDDGEEEQPEPPPAPRSRSREGLPPAYRMRHAPHYVEQLMGDTPLQTVRQISIDEIDAVTAGPGRLTSTDLPRPSARSVFFSRCS